MASTDTHIFILCIIGIVQLVCSTDDFLEAIYSKNIHYPNLIPSHGGFYLVERLDISLVQCVTLCLITGSECVGVFYNQHLKTCNSMSNPGNMELLLKTQSGSEYFSENREYCVKNTITILYDWWGGLFYACILGLFSILSFSTYCVFSHVTIYGPINFFLIVRSDGIISTITVTTGV